MVKALSYQQYLSNNNQAHTTHIWNDLLFKCENPNVFLSYEWGEYKSTSWMVERIIFVKGNTFIGLTQITFKKMGPFLFGWCASGIGLVNFSELPEVITAFKAFFNMKTTVVRFNFFDPSGMEKSFIVDSIKDLSRVKKSINSGYTVRFDLAQHLNENNCSRNHRYYLKKAKGHNLHFNLGKFDLDNFLKVHDQMVAHKDLLEITIDSSDLSRLSACFGDHLYFALVKDQNGECLSAALLIIFNDFAYYYLAGAGDLGRRQHASFFMIDEILKHLKTLGIKQFDFGGITPFKENAKGVNRFKMGLEGKVVKYIGERNLGDSKIMKWIFDLILGHKLS